MLTPKQLLEQKIAENKRLQGMIDDNNQYIRVLSDLTGQKGRRPARGANIKKTNIERAAEIIKEAGRPLHANEIVDKLGWRKTLRNKVSIASSMAHYSNKGKIFKRVEPNTFDVITRH